MQEALLIPEIRPERFLDPSAGTGMFISTLKDVPEIHCFEKDRLTGRILSSLYPESKVNGCEPLAADIPFPYAIIGGCRDSGRKLGLYHADSDSPARRLRRCV